MKKLVNILCVFMMLAVAGTASADIRTFINEDGKEDWVYDPNYEDPKIKSAGVHYGFPESLCDSEEGLENKLRCRASINGMTFDDYLAKKVFNKD